MDDFAEVLLSSHPCLQRKDCLPISDVVYRIIYGRCDWSPIRLDISFGLERMIVRKLIIRPDLQNQGIGSTIVAYLKRESGRLQIPVIGLYIVLPESRRFWKEHGFELNDEPDGCGGRWVRPEE